MLRPPCQSKIGLFEATGWKLLLLLTLLTTALLAWWPMDYYQDEFVYRILNARFIQDGPLHMGLFSLCEAWHTHIPPLFHLPAWLSSWWYLQADPMTARAAVFALVLLFFVSVSGLCIRPASFLLLGSLVGLAGSSMLLTRPEYLHLLNIAICLIALRVSVAEQGSPAWLVRLCLAALILLSFQLSLYSHLQGVLFLPLNLYALYRLLRPHRIWLVAISLSLLAISAIGVQYKQAELACDNNAALAQELASYQHPLTALPAVIFSTRLLDKTSHYLGQFVYKKQHAVDYLPPITVSKPVLILNAAILLTVLMTLLMGVMVSVCSVRQLVSKTASPSFKRCNAVVVLLLITPALGLWLINTGQHFYRCFFIHLLITAGLTWYFTRRQQTASTPAYLMLALVLPVYLASTLFNYSNIVPAFKSTDTSYGAKLASLQKPQLPTINKRCGLDLTQGRLLVDAIAYERLKHVPHLYPLEYLGFQSRKSGLPIASVLADMNMQGWVASCASTAETGQLCCRSFNAKPE